MVFGRLVFAIVTSASIGCAAGEVDDPKGPSSPTTDQAMLESESSSCSLARVGIKFGTEACTSCMQRECCTETSACFGPTQSSCRGLHACVLSCPVGSIIAVGSGDIADNPCVATCEATHAAALPAHDAYDACIRTRCMPACDS